MICRDCEKGELVICPECGKDIVVCLEDNISTHNIKYWDNPIGCDGIE